MPGDAEMHSVMDAIRFMTPVFLQYQVNSNKFDATKKEKMK